MTNWLLFQKEAKLTVNPQFSDSKSPSAGDRYADLNVSQFICPVSGLEMNGKYRFCILWACGCVLSEKSLREIETGLKGLFFIIFTFSSS